MGMCKNCSVVVSSLTMIDGLCPKCQAPEIVEMKAQEKEEQEKTVALTEQRENELRSNRFTILNSIMVTTEMMIDIEIEERIEITSTQCIYGINILKDLFSAIRDIVGGRVKNLENALETARKEVIVEMKEKAYLAGGNAIIGMKIEHTYNNAGGGSILSIFATGTIVKLKK